MGFLTDLKIRTASPSAKEYLLADGDGLHLRVRATSKSWLYRYKSDAKQVKIGLGAYPTSTLAIARELTREANTCRQTTDQVCSDRRNCQSNPYPKAHSG